MCFVSLGCGHVCGIPVDLVYTVRLDFVPRFRSFDLSIEAFLSR